jgi:hypothetical protein
MNISFTKWKGKDVRNVVLESNDEAVTSNKLMDFVSKKKEAKIRKEKIEDFEAVQTSGEKLAKKITKNWKNNLAIGVLILADYKVPGGFALGDV